MTVLLKKPVAKTTPIHVVDRASFATHLRTAAEATRRWLQATGFQGEADRHVLVPAADGSLKEVWAGVDAVDSPWALRSGRASWPRWAARCAMATVPANSCRSPLNAGTTRCM